MVDKLETQFSSKEVLYAFSLYYRMLYVINQDFVKLCGLDAYREALKDSDEDRAILMRMLGNIVRIIPFSKDGKAGILKLNNDSLMAFEGHPNFGNLKQDYKNILQTNANVLSDAKYIRNKYEHSPHIIRQIAVMSSSSQEDELFSFVYEIRKSTYEIKYSDVLVLVAQLNQMFDGIRSELIAANELDGTEINFKLLSMYGMSLLRFNRIYKSNILNDIGRIMWPI